MNLKGICTTHDVYHDIQVCSSTASKTVLVLKTIQGGGVIHIMSTEIHFCMYIWDHGVAAEIVVLWLGLGDQDIVLGSRVV